jgi:NAD(P)H-hydrate repair Nnr-like enzyme with NAD(P)H-hydrate epimerase domain
MVAGAFPLFKLMSLAAKQLSKPIANAIKSGAKQSNFFRKYICVIPGQGV